MNDHSATDGDLISRHLAGDPRAFTELMERHQRRVYNLAYRMLGNAPDAADAAQEVFLTCLRKLSGFRGDAAFSTWLYRVALNVCHDALRKRGRELLFEEPPEAPLAAAAPDPADAAAAAADVQRALMRVPEEFRTVLILHDVQDLPYEEIAETVGVPLGTVKSRLHRARAALGRVLRGEPADPSPPSKLEETT